MYGYAQFEIGGIQKYIFATGKLKEMIGGSELIEEMAKDLLNEFKDTFHINGTPVRFIDAEEAEAPHGENVLIMQRNAGTVFLLFEKLETAAEFITGYSEYLIERFPGLPLFAALEGLEITGNCKKDVTAYNAARDRLKIKIAAQRNLVTPPSGLPIEPIFDVASRDGMPAVAHNIYNEEKNISLNSCGRMNEKLIKNSDARLQFKRFDPFRRQAELDQKAYKDSAMSEGRQDPKYLEIKTKMDVAEAAGDNKAMKKYRTQLKRLEEKTQKAVNKNTKQTNNLSDVQQKYLKEFNEKSNAFFAEHPLPGTEDRDSPLTWDDTYWPKEIEEIASEDGKVAFIHMDGNDFGKMFQGAIEKVKKDEGNSIFDGIRELGKLSNQVSIASEYALCQAILKLLPYCEFGKEGHKTKRGKETVKDKYIMPLRPVVVGGDDLTVVIRADLSLIFIDAFEKAFEEKTAEISADKQPLTMGFAMVVAKSTYPFIRAFNLSEQLLKSAKKKTEKMTPRRASLDYLVITNDVGNDLENLRDNTCIAEDGSLLTSKPFLLDGYDLPDFINETKKVLDTLSRSAVRSAVEDCRKGVKESMNRYSQLRMRVSQEVGGRNNTDRLTLDEFKRIFPESFFNKTADGLNYTRLGDYLELDHLITDRNKNIYRFYASLKGDK